MKKKGAKPELKVLLASAEIAPFAKEGGLADVAGSLPKALAERGCDARAIMPLYKIVDRKKFNVEPLPGMEELAIPMGEKQCAARIYQTKMPGSEVTVYLVENDFYYGREGVYNDRNTGEGFPDNSERFIFLQKAMLAFLRAFDWKPGVIHANDNHTALVPYYLKRNGGSPLAGTATLFSIHNLAYQGVDERAILHLAEIPEEIFYPMSPFEFYGKVNMMKIGIVFADVITTVSPTYAREIQSGPEFGCGLEGTLRDRSADLHGIINGVDYSVWSPENDELIPHKFSAQNPAGKVKNKKALLRSYKLPFSEEVPVIGIVSRLADQKGFDILEEALEGLMELDVQMVVLGTGSRRYHEMFERAVERFPKKMGVRLAFDNKLAHLIEAGSDMFLMPSRYEPCGLNQLYSLRYGAVPVVRSTGGLADSIRNYDPETGEGNGFKFEEYSAAALLSAVKRAVETFADPQPWQKVMSNGMRDDFSWGASAEKYIELYGSAADKARQG